MNDSAHLTASKFYYEAIFNIGKQKVGGNFVVLNLFLTPCI